jgi:hypothetical protein
VQPIIQNEVIGGDEVLRPRVLLRTTIVVLSVLGISDVRAQQTPRAELSGKWQLRAQAEKGKEEVSTLDLTESGSSVMGTVAPSKGNPLTITDGYRVGDAIKISATGRQGLFSRSIEISGHIEGDRMILNVKKGSGATYPAIAERMTVSRER